MLAIFPYVFSNSCLFFLGLTLIKFDIVKASSNFKKISGGTVDKSMPHSSRVDIKLWTCSCLLTLEKHIQDW